jgi:5-bromo-4-chloroindolyl phosphate hydrolysis protein
VFKWAVLGIIVVILSSVPGFYFHDKSLLLDMITVTFMITSVTFIFLGIISEAFKRC